MNPAIRWCRVHQRWARRQLRNPDSHALAVLGLSDALMEEVLLLDSAKTKHGELVAESPNWWDNWKDGSRSVGSATTPCHHRGVKELAT